MDIPKLTEKYRALIGDPFELATIKACNYEPDEFVFAESPDMHARRIATGKVTFDEVMKEVQDKGILCDQCHQPYSAHTHDTVLFLRLTRNCTPKEADAVLVKLKAPLIADKIDGAAMVETPEKFRMNEPEPTAKK